MTGPLLQAMFDEEARIAKLRGKVRRPSIEIDWRTELATMAAAVAVVLIFAALWIVTP